MTGPSGTSLLRYFSVATCGFCVDFGVYAALIYLGASVYLSNLVGFVFGAAVNVILIRAFVFPDSRFRLADDLSLTILANGAMLTVGTGILWILVELFRITPYWAKLMANGITFFLNYLTRAAFFRK